MGLEELEKQLMVDAKKESETTLSKATQEKEKIIAAALEKKKQIFAQAKNSAQELSQKERNERISAANLRAAQMIDEKKNEIVDLGLQQVWQELIELIDSKDYQKLLKKLIAEGEKELGKQCIVFVNKKDFADAKKISLNVSKSPIEIAGGAIIATKDEKVRVNNSLEAIFEQNKENIRREIFNELFLAKRGKR